MIMSYRLNIIPHSYMTEMSTTHDHMNDTPCLEVKIIVDCLPILSLLWISYLLIMHVSHQHVVIFFCGKAFS
jgi:hypothetical protein